MCEYKRSDKDGLSCRTKTLAQGLGLNYNFVIVIFFFSFRFNFYQVLIQEKFKLRTYWPTAKILGQIIKAARLTLIDVLFFIVPLELCCLDRKIQHLLSGYIMADRLLHSTNNIIYIVQQYVKLSVGKQRFYLNRKSTHFLFKRAGKCL